MTDKNASIFFITDDVSKYAVDDSSCALWGDKELGPCFGWCGFFSIKKTFFSSFYDTHKKHVFDGYTNHFHRHNELYSSFDPLKAGVERGNAYHLPKDIWKKIGMGSNGKMTVIQKYIFILFFVYLYFIYIYIYFVFIFIYLLFLFKIFENSFISFYHLD